MVRDRINAAARWVPTWVVYGLYALPAPLFFWMAATGQMGPEPINALLREYGEIALQLLIIGLCISPSRRYLGVNLLKFRRAFGLLAFFYVTLHLAVWAVLDLQSLERIWADIVKRPYITVGFTAFLLMVPLALTSNAWSVRRLGVRWRQLHKLTYGIAILGAVHFIWLAKGFQIEPLVYLTVILGLLAVRMPGTRRASA
jgi:sulfoxide reductase heme-binding subunit YedZ